MRLRRLPIALSAVGLLALAAGAAAASPTKTTPGPWQAPSGALQIPLWPAGAAIAHPETGKPESVVVGGSVAGRPVTGVEDVSRPTMTIFRPKGLNTGVAVLVFPGGGYQDLAIDLEGTEVCDWLTTKGVTCVVLKYRAPQNWHPAGCDCQREPKPPLALQDAQRAMGLLRQRARSLGVDPHRIGVLGFSAGGHLVTAVSNAETRRYAPVDAADSLSSRPDFAVALYPGHLWSGRGMELYPFNPIRKDGPPTFILQAEDDPVDDVRNSIAYFLALKAAGVPVEMHIYAQGGHAFGLRRAAAPITGWPRLVERWLQTIRMLPAR